MSRDWCGGLRHGIPGLSRAGIIVLFAASVAEAVFVGRVHPGSAPAGTVFAIRATGSGFSVNGSYSVRVGSSSSEPCAAISTSELECDGLGSTNLGVGDILLSFSEANATQPFSHSLLRVYEVPSVQAAWVAGSAAMANARGGPNITLPIEGHAKVFLNLSTEVPLLGPPRVRLILPGNSSTDFRDVAFANGASQITARSPSVESFVGIQSTGGSALAGLIEVALDGVHFVPTGVTVTFEHVAPLRVKFIQDYDFSQPGHNFNVNQARLEAQQRFGQRIHTSTVVVNPGDPRFEFELWHAIEVEGCRLIVLSSDQQSYWFEPWLANASRHGARFFTIGGTRVHPAHSSGLGQIFQTSFLLGIALGAGASANGISRIGVFQGQSVGYMCQQPNAVFLGIHRACPQCQVEFMTPENWVVGNFAGLFVEHFAQRGIRALSSTMVDQALELEAVRRDMLAVTLNADMLLRAGENILASQTHKWTSMVQRKVLQVLDGEWKSEHLLWDLAQGGVALFTLSPKIGVTGRSLLLDYHQRMMEGWKDIYCPEDHGLDRFVMSDGTTFEPTPERPCMRFEDVNQIFDLPWVRHQNPLGEALLYSAISPSCPPGTHYNVSGACERCASGRHQPRTLTGAPSLDDGMACDPCPRGHSCSQDGMGPAEPCEAGFVAPQVGQIACERCSCGLGELLDLSSEDAAGGLTCPCVPCPPGTHAAGNGTCAPCGAGSYQPLPGQLTCRSCGGGRITAAAGARDETQCVCPGESLDSRGMYLSLSGACRPCPEKMRCPFGSTEASLRSVASGAGPGQDSSGVAVPYPLVEGSFWTPRGDPLSVFRCKTKRHCPGGDPETCAPHLAGQGCPSCIDGFYWDGAACHECSSPEKSMLIFPALACIIAFPVISLMYYFSRDPLSRWGSWQNTCITLGFITLTHYQVLALINTAEVQKVSLLGDVWKIWSVANDVLSVFRVDCAGFSGFTVGFVLKAVSPMVLLAFTGAIYGGSRILARAWRPEVGMDFDGTWNVFFSLIFTFFTGIANMAMSLFKCTDSPNGKATINQDPSMNCYEGEWNSLIVAGAAAVLVYCFGCGLLFGRAVLSATRDSNFSNRSFQRRWKFLFIKFRPDVHWWSLALLVRGVLTNLGFVVFIEGLSQLYWVMCSETIYLCATVFWMPWRSRVANLVSVAASLSLMFACASNSIYADRSAASDDVVGKLTLCLSFGPLMMLVCVALWTAVRGRFQQAHLDTDPVDILKEVLSGLATLDGQALTELYLRTGEWDRCHVLKFCEVVRAEYLAMSTSHRTVNRASIEKIVDFTMTDVNEEQSVRVDTPTLKPHVASTNNIQH